MATSRLAVGSFMDAIVGITTTVSSVFNTTTKSVGMLDAFVTKASVEQTKQHIADDLAFNETLAHDHATNMSSLHLKAEEFCKKSPAHAKFYNSAYGELMSLIKPQAQSDSESD